MIRELDLVALTCELADQGLRAGDIGTVVLLHGSAGYEVEFPRSGRRGPAVLTLNKDQVRALEPGELQRWGKRVRQA